MKNPCIEAEKKVGVILKNKFKQSFNEKSLIIGRRSNGDEIRHRFDLVSEDEKIVAEVKSSKLGNEKTRKAGYSTTRKWRLLGDCFYLEKCDAKKKILALTDRELFEQFSKEMDGLLPSIDIEFFETITS